MPLQTQTFEQYLQNMVSAIQAENPQLTDFTSGSPLLALSQANIAAVAIPIQALLITLLAFARAQTSNGTDLDSWVAQFGSFPRKQALPASGDVQFYRFTTGNQATIVVGQLVEASVGSVLFTVQADTNNPNFSPSANAYIIPPSVQSILVPVSAVVPGASGNVSANAIDTLYSSIPYVDLVSNPSAFTNGQDSESDSSYLARFVLYFNSLSKATKTAIEAAILDYNNKLNINIVENEDYAGNFKPGFFFVILDDGTGSASNSLINDVKQVVEQVRGLTISFDVYAVASVNVTITAQITISPDYDEATIISQTETALNNYINGLKIGEGLPYTRVAQIIYNVSIGITDVTAIVLNGGTSDLTINDKQTLKPLSVVISPTP